MRLTWTSRHVETANFGEGEEEPFRAQGRSGQADDFPGFQEDTGTDDRGSGRAERESGKDAGYSAGRAWLTSPARIRTPTHPSGGGPNA
jgi:hypothetical protein